MASGETVDKSGSDVREMLGVVMLYSKAALYKTIHIATLNFYYPSNSGVSLDTMSSAKNIAVPPPPKWVTDLNSTPAARPKNTTIPDPPGFTAPTTVSTKVRIPISGSGASILTYSIVQQVIQVRRGSDSRP